MKTGMKYIGVLLVLLLASRFDAAAQKWSLSTNAVDYLCLATLNIEASYAPAQHWSITATAKYNPFTWHNRNGQFQAKQQCYSVGTRYWPWHCYSGWWVALKVQYQEYGMGGIVSRRTEEGDRVGAGIAAGYTYMLHPHWNLDFGVGMWAGRKWYSAYSCPRCGMLLEKGSKGFVLPNDLTIAVCYVF